MSSIQELREKRTAKAREYRNLLDSHTGAIPEEAGKQLDTLEDEISALDDAIALSLIHISSCRRRTLTISWPEPTAGRTTGATCNPSAMPATAARPSGRMAGVR